ncbi:hypothetical protein ACHAXH_007534 [Discostella pseudostelligera]
MIRWCSRPRKCLVRDGVVAGAGDVVSSSADADAAASPTLPVFDDDTEALPRDDAGVDNIIREDDVGVEGGGGGGGVRFGATGAPAPSAAEPKTSNDERQCLLFFLDRADEEEAAIVVAGVVGEEDATGRGWGWGVMLLASGCGGIMVNHKLAGSGKMKAWKKEKGNKSVWPKNQFVFFA